MSVEYPEDSEGTRIARKVREEHQKQRQRSLAAPGCSENPVGHPEDICDDCGRANVVWFAPSPLWNIVARRPDGTDPMLCPTCFIHRANKAGQGHQAWKISQEFVGEDSPNSRICDTGNKG